MSEHLTPSLPMEAPQQPELVHPIILNPEEVELRIKLFRTFVEQHGNVLIKIAFRKCRNTQRAEDAVQEVLTRMSARFADPTFILKNQVGFPVNLNDQDEVFAAMRSYITRSVGTQLIDMSRRHSNNDALLGEDTPHPPTEELGYRAADTSDTFETLQAHLANATPSTKRGIAYLVLAAQGYSYIEIGDREGLPESTIRARIFRARAWARAVLQPDKSTLLG